MAAMEQLTVLITIKHVTLVERDVSEASEDAQTQGPRHVVEIDFPGRCPFDI